MIDVNRLKKLNIGQSAGKLLRESIMSLNPFFNAFFGDGCLNKPVTCVNYRCRFDSSNQELINAKHKLFKAYNPSPIAKKAQSTKAYGKLPIYHFGIGTNQEATRFSNLSIVDKINSLTLWDFILWYLDDGSYHVTRNSMHLYSNKIGFEGNQLLIEKLKTLDIFASLATDRKKDGRVFHYLYLRRESVEKIMIPKVKLFLKIIECPSMLYKVGIGFYVKPSSTSHNDVRSSTPEMGDTGNCEDIVRANKKLLEV